MSTKNDGTRNEAVAQEPIPRHIYDELMRKLNTLELENDTYRQKSPLVGVRWYGEGGFGIGLSHPVNGQNRISLDGFDDSAVIDYSTWLRIKGTEQAKDGLLIRDDTVIEEKQVMGNTAPADNTQPGPNSVTAAEADTLLRGSVAQLKKRVKKMTSHWGPIRLLHTMKKSEIKDQAKSAYLREHRDALQCAFRWGLLHPHDLKLACENYGVMNFLQMSQDQMVQALTKREIEMLRQDDTE